MGAAVQPVRQTISIHALREEGDALGIEISRNVHISIHALREEGDLRIKIDQSGYKIFLSTPSARRATILSPTT